MKRPEAPGRDVPALYQGIAVAATRSRAAAVKLFCLECVGYIRKDVTECTATKCSLFRWRPYQSGDDEGVVPPEISGVTQRSAEHEGSDLTTPAAGRTPAKTARGSKFCAASDAPGGMRGTT